MARGTGGGSGFGQPGAIIQLLHLLTLRSYIQTCLKKLNVISFSEAGQNENHLSKIPSISVQYSEKPAEDKAASKFYWHKGLNTGTLSYIKSAKGKSPALFGKVDLGSSKEEFGHEDMPTGLGVKIPALLFFQTVSFHFQV